MGSEENYRLDREMLAHVAGFIQDVSFRKVRMTAGRATVCTFLALGLLLVSAPEASAQLRKGRAEHLFTLHRASERLSFGNLVDVCFEPRYREVYVADSGRNTIWVFDSDGFLLHHFGQGIGLRNAKSVAVSSDGRAFVPTWSKSGKYSIRVCDIRGRSLGWFPPKEETRGPRVAAPEWAAQRFAADRLTNIDFLDDRANVLRIPPDDPLQRGPAGRIEMGPDGCLYVYETGGEGKGGICAYDMEGNLKRRIRGNPSSGVLAGGMAVRPNGEVLATNLDRGVVVVYNEQGEEVGTVGRRGGAPGKLSFPTDVALGLDGSIYVVDRHRHTILVYDSEGRLQYEFGGQGHRDGFFFFPSAACVDDENRLWVADLSQRIQVFALPGNVYNAVR